MKDLNVIVYTMKGCPHCIEFKKMLKEAKIKFFDRDIDKFQKEYDLFSEITKNDMVPAMLIIEGDADDYKSYTYVPEKNYNELNEAVDIIRGHQVKLGIIK
jgi:glutaredoxin